MAVLQVPLAGVRIIVNRRSYVTDERGHITVARQTDIDVLLARGWTLIAPPPLAELRFDSGKTRWSDA